jgi:hypothetical protein
MKPDRQAEASDWLTALETPRRELTTWEVDFLDSIREQIEAGRRLSDRQLDIVERIYAEKTD